MLYCCFNVHYNFTEYQLRKITIYFTIITIQKVYAICNERKAIYNFCIQFPFRLQSLWLLPQQLMDLAHKEHLDCYKMIFWS